jgi:hypothetical protein
MNTSIPRGSTGAADLFDTEEEDEEDDETVTTEEGNLDRNAPVANVLPIGQAAEDACFFSEQPYVAPRGNPQSARWMGTLNNYTPEEWDKIRDLPGVTYGIIGKERAPQTGTIHAQFALWFSSNQRFKHLQGLFDKRVSWTIPTAVNTARIIEYCRKGDQPKPNWKKERKYIVGKNLFGVSDASLWLPGKEVNWVEWGTPPVNPGKRSERLAVKEAVTENVKRNVGHCDMYELLDNHFESYSHCKPSTDLWVTLSEAKLQRELTLEDRDECDWELRPWQRHVLEKIRDPLAREIIFVVDTQGNAGKSCFITRLECDHPELPLFECAPGKKADVAFSLKEFFPRPRIVYMDCPREKTQYIPYHFLEECKNGKVKSTKYQPCTVRTYGKAGFVGCFMNEFPDMTKLSRDRYYVIHIVDKDGEPDIYTEETGFPENLFPPVDDPSEEVYEPRLSKRQRYSGGNIGGNAAMSEMSEALRLLVENQNLELEYRRRRRKIGDRPTVNSRGSEDDIPQPLSVVQKMKAVNDRKEKLDREDHEYPSSGRARKRAAIAHRKDYPLSAVAKLRPLSVKTAPRLKTVPGVNGGAMITPASENSTIITNLEERNWLRHPPDSPDKENISPSAHDDDDTLPDDIPAIYHQWN